MVILSLCSNINNSNNGGDGVMVAAVAPAEIRKQKCAKCICMFFTAIDIRHFLLTPNVSVVFFSGYTFVRALDIQQS